MKNLEAENKALKERLEMLEKAALRAEALICDANDLLESLNRVDDAQPALLHFAETAFDGDETLDDIHDALKRALPDHFDLD